MPLKLSAFREIVEKINDAVMVTEAQPLEEAGPPIVYVNPALCRLTGYEEVELQGQRPGLMHGPLTDPGTLMMLTEALRGGQAARLELLLYHRNSMPYWAEVSLWPLFDDAGAIGHYVFVLRDATEVRMKREALYRMAVSDDLTQLFNRQMFFDVGAKFMQLTLRQGAPLAVAALEVDGLDDIRAMYGHLVVEMVLRIVAQTLRASVRDSDVAGRLEHGQFGLLLPEADLPAARVVLERIRQTLAGAFRAASLPRGAHATMSMGVAAALEQENELAAVLARARLALEQGRQQGADHIEMAS